MNSEDYFKYYIQGSDHYLIPKDIFDELFNELVNWREESKELKERINKAKDYIMNAYIEVLKYDDEPSETTSYEIVTVDLLKILKGKD